MFFELVQVAIGVRERLSRNPSDEEWDRVFQMADVQAVAAFVFPALERLSKLGQRPPTEVLLEWFGLAEQVRAQNRQVNRAIVNLTDSLKKDGCRCCILKGQGNALMYPDPMNRQPGDIDIWMKEVERGKCKVESVVSYVKTKNPQAHAMYHHIDYRLVDGVEVEVHYRPSFMFNPWHNRRLQRWFTKHAEEQFRNEAEMPDGAGTIHIPTAAFNVVFQLSHVYNHLLHEGVGLRQVIDFFYVLRSLKGSHTEATDYSGLLRYLGLDAFAGAMMWVLHDVLGLPEEFLIAPKDERRGRVLMAEIMRGGNFGMYDSDNIKADSRLKKNLQRFKRDMRMMRYFPSECLSEPFFRTYHFLWRMRYNTM